MKNIKLLLLLISTCFYVYPCLAQNNQNDHYIIGQTLHGGTINIAIDQNGSKNSERILRASDVYNAGIAYYYGKGRKTRLQYGR